jgi:hypothetical protein
MEKMDALYGLVIVIAALLVSACWNAWLLLMEEQKPGMSSKGLKPIWPLLRRFNRPSKKGN